jgi:hypothetical protein
VGGSLARDAHGDGPDALRGQGQPQPDLLDPVDLGTRPAVEEVDVVGVRADLRGLDVELHAQRARVQLAGDEAGLLRSGRRRPHEGALAPSTRIANPTSAAIARRSGPPGGAGSRPERGRPPAVAGREREDRAEQRDLPGERQP